MGFDICHTFFLSILTASLNNNFYHKNIYLNYILQLFRLQLILIYKVFSSSPYIQTMVRSMLAPDSDKIYFKNMQTFSLLYKWQVPPKVLLKNICLGCWQSLKQHLTQPPLYIEENHPLFKKWYVESDTSISIKCFQGWNLSTWFLFSN